MKISEAILGMIIKKGLILEMRNTDFNLGIPYNTEAEEEKYITVNVKAENMTIKVLKEDA